MATVLIRSRPAQADERFVLYGIDWGTYDAISRVRRFVDQVSPRFR